MAKKNSKLGAETREIAKLIYKGKIKPGQIDQESIRLMAEELMPAIFKGYGKTFSTIDPSVTDYRVLSRLEDNVHVFSGFKSHRELMEISGLLTKNGKVVSEHDFLQAVKAIDKTYNESYKRAEYDLAISSAQNAELWQRVQEEKEAFPFVQYVAVIDGHETPYCHYLNGKVFSVDDPILKTIWPPNHWRCRSHFMQLSDGEPSTIEPELMPKIAKMFQNNVGVNGEVFPDTHPYFKLPANEVAYVEKEIGMLIPGRWENYKRYKALLKDSRYTDVTFNKDTGGFTATHNLQSKSERKVNQQIAKELADEGFGVTLKGVKKKGNSFDATLSKKGNWEFKAPQSGTKNAIQQNVSDAKKQSENIVIYLKKSPRPDQVSKGLWNAVGLHDKEERIKRVMIKVSGQRSLTLSREEIISGRATQLLEKYFK